MEIQAAPLDWTHIDEENWSKFLGTETGKRLIPKLVEQIPELLASGDVNSILIRSGEVRGIKLLVERLFDLTHSQKNAPVENAVSTGYPAPEDDRAWNDGQKIVIEKPENPTIAQE